MEGIQCYYSNERLTVKLSVMQNFASLEKIIARSVVSLKKMI